MWKRLKSTILLKHPRITVAEDDVLLPSGKVIQYIRYANRGGNAIVIRFKDGKLLVQPEYSYPVDRVLYQFPGGGLKPGERPVDAARRELHEEANLLAHNLQPLGYVYFDNRRSDAKLHVFLATDPEEVPGSPDDEEDIGSEWVSIAEFSRMIQGGKINNITMLAAWSLFNATGKTH